MAYYFLTYRIADKIVGALSSEDRRNRLIDNVHERGEVYWDETSSFMIVGSPLGLDAFSRTACRGLSRADDLVLIIEPAGMNATRFGRVANPEVVDSFFARVAALP